MRMYSVISALVFTLLACSTSKLVPAVAPTDYGISYSVPLNAAARANLAGLSAVVSYQGSAPAQCDISFRLYVAADTNPIDYALKSRNYVGSYTIGGACKELFQIPLRTNADFLALQAPNTLHLVIVPIDLDGNKMTIDLRRNFSLRIQ